MSWQFRCWTNIFAGVKAGNGKVPFAGMRSGFVFYLYGIEPQKAYSPPL